MLSFFKVYAAESRGVPLGFNSLSVLSVQGMGGWPGDCRTNNTLVYAAWMQMIDWGHKLGDCVRQKASYMQSCFVHEFGSLGLRFIISPWGLCLIWPLLALVWCVLLCYGCIFSALLRIVTNSDSESSNKQSPRRTADSTPVQRERAPHWDFPCFSENWGR